MINFELYRKTLSASGTTTAAVRKQQSNMVINNTFTQDPTYKKVYILTPNGWKFEDAKYQFHSTPSIVKDAVDYYLQFRPKVHYPIGSYVIVPDDTDETINLTEQELVNPFLQPMENRTQWWMIVNKDNANAFVKHSILKCNWNFQWMYKGKIRSCYGAIRSANSYTSGKWTDEISSSVDNLTGAWLPDLHHVYGDKLFELGMDDNRTLQYEQRFLLGNNALEPRVYQVTKIVDLSPQGIVKLSLKQDEFHPDRDNNDLRICDYYQDSGNAALEEPDKSISQELVNIIHWMTVNDNNELEYIEDSTNEKLHIGQTSYFKIDFIDVTNVGQWNLSCVDSDDCEYYEGLMKIDIINASTISIRPGKANSLIGKKFLLTATNEEQGIYSSIDLEVDE